MSTSQSRCGERALMCAVLEDAVECLAGRRAPQRLRAQLATEARVWLEDRDRHWPFSFERICATLDLDADKLRARLLAGAPALPLDEEVARAVGRRRNPSPDPTDVIRMIRSGHSLRVVARTLGISVPRVSTLSRALASRLRATRDAEIRRLRRAGWTSQALATRFGLSRVRVTRICARRVPDEPTDTATMGFGPPVAFRPGGARYGR